jgi:uncharacterized RDD family membrane protein YckC
MQENATTRQRFPSIRRRLAAMVYESFLISAVVLVAAFAYLPLFGGAETPFRKAVFQLYLLIVLALYFLVFWTRGGQTLAMKTWRIRLVGRGGNRVSVPRGLLRLALAALGLACFGVGFLWALLDPQRQFLHDRLAGTRLVLA